MKMVFNHIQEVVVSIESEWAMFPAAVVKEAAQRIDDFGSLLKGSWSCRLLYFLILISYQQTCT